MDGGRVVEQGTHDELVRRGGRYSQLLAFQRNLDDTSEEDTKPEVLLNGN